MVNKDPLVCTGLWIYYDGTHYFYSKFGIIGGIFHVFGLQRTQDHFLIHLGEVNFEQLSSVPIQRPAFKTGGLLHTVAQVFTPLPFDNKLTTPHPKHHGTLCLFDHPVYYYLQSIYFQLNVIDYQFTTIPYLLVAVFSTL